MKTQQELRRSYDAEDFHPTTNSADAMAVAPFGPCVKHELAETLELAIVLFAQKLFTPSNQ